MRKRKNIIEDLKENVPTAQLYKVELLKKELNEFFINLSIYTADNSYIELYTILYQIQSPKSYLDICEEMHINEKKIKKFKKRTESFIRNYIKEKTYLNSLGVYIQKD